MVNNDDGGSTVGTPHRAECPGCGRRFRRETPGSAFYCEEADETVFLTEVGA